MSDAQTISRDDLRLALRAELAELELRLLEKLVTKSEYAALVARHDLLVSRVSTIEAHGSPQAQEQHGQITVLQDTMSRNVAWRNRMAGGIAVLSGFALVAAPVVFQHYF